MRGAADRTAAARHPALSSRNLSAAPLVQAANGRSSIHSVRVCPWHGASDRRPPSAAAGRWGGQPSTTRHRDVQRSGADVIGDEPALGGPFRTRPGAVIGRARGEPAFTVLELRAATSPSLRRGRIHGQSCRRRSWSAWSRPSLATRPLQTTFAARAIRRPAPIPRPNWCGFEPMTSVAGRGSDCRPMVMIIGST